MRGFASVGFGGAAIVLIASLASPTLAQTGPRTLDQALAGTAHIQPAYDIGTQAWDADDQRDDVARLNAQSAFNIAADRPFGPAVEFETDFAPDASGMVAATRRDVWREGDSFTDRLTLVTEGRLRRADGSPLPVTPQDRSELDPERYDVRFVRGWPVAIS